MAALKASFATVAKLRCDLVVTPHPSANDLYARLAGRASLDNPRGCIDLAATSAAKLNERLQKERTDGRKLALLVRGRQPTGIQMWPLANEIQKPPSYPARF